MKTPLVIAILLLAFAAHAQTGDEAARRNIDTVQQRLRERPDDPTLWFFLARFQAQAGDARACAQSLEKVAQLGDGYLPTREGFERVWNDAAFNAARAKLEAKLPRLDFAPTAFEIDDRKLIPEGIAYDVPSRTLFMGSIAEKRIVRVDANRAAGEFAGITAGLDSVLGLAVDSPRRILYAVSTSALTTEGMKRPRNQVFAFDIDSRRLLARYDVPDAKQLNDVAVAPGGRVFTSDSGSGAIFEIPVKTPAAARVVLPAGQLRGSNGLAASPDAKRLYVAHSTGIAVIDLATGQAKGVANETRENVAAIDGLYAWQGQLIGVENVTNPGRVIVMSLASDGGSIVRVQTLLSHHHNALDEPTTGAISPDGFLLLAATGASHYNRQGAVENPETVPMPTIVRIPLPR